MIKHYFIVAIRNIFKNKQQSAFSLLGLALSFACASFAIYWSYYEISFDSFHRNADRIYRIRKNENGAHISQYTYGNILSPLKNNYQEIEKICAIRTLDSDVINQDGNVIIPAKDISFSYVTSDIFDIFDFEWTEGNFKILSQGGNKVAISETVAKQLTGSDSSIGFKFFIEEDVYEVGGVYKTWSKHSNLKLDIIHVLPEYDEIFTKGSFTYAMFRSNVNVERFIQKIKTDTITHWLGQFPQILNLWTPLKALHYTYPKDERNVYLSDVYLFSGFAILLSVCALFNYLTLFISRIRVGSRNMALRIMCGSSAKQLGLLLMIEYSLLLLGALLNSLLFIEIGLKSFIELSQIEVDRTTIFVGCGYLLLFIVVLSLLFSLVPIFYFKGKVLRVEINTVPVRLRNKGLRLTAVCFQLAVSVFFMFCTTVMMKQIYHLLYTDLNVERTRIAVVQSAVGADRIMDILRQIPFINEMAPIFVRLFPLQLYVRQEAVSWEEKNANIHSIPYQHVWINDSMFHFYGLKIKKGIQVCDLKENEILINETFSRRMGEDNPIGKSINSHYIIKGIVYDFQSQSPTLQTPPICFFYKKTSFRENQVAFKFDGDFFQCENSIREAFEKEGITYTLEDCEAEYRKLLEPEYNILKLIGIIFVISLLMALWGIYALVLQSCEQHCKEIAIRKICGARVIDILSLFFSQYMQQVVIAAVVAFPIGYWVIKHWLEQYSLQTSITIWEFLLVFFIVVLLVTLCVSRQVWQAANENPTKVVKKV